MELDITKLLNTILAIMSRADLRFIENGIQAFDDFQRVAQQRREYRHALLLELYISPRRVRRIPYRPE